MLNYIFFQFFLFYIKMRKKVHQNFIYLLFLFFFIILCNGQNNNSNFTTSFIMDLYDPNDNLNVRYLLEYDVQRGEYVDHYKIHNTLNIKTAIVCSEEDMNLPEDNKNTIVFWNTANYNEIYSSVIYMDAFPLWYNQQKKKGKRFCLRVEAVGWDKNVSEKINCDDPENKQLCPDLIILGTTQFSYRYYKDETLNLNKYFRNYFKKEGRSLESMLNKYAHYDYRIDNNWLAVPIISDLRALRFNKKTFDYCINKGYNLHYPPPFSDFWGSNYKETWTWEKAFEYSEIIYNCTGNPGFRIIGSKSEDTKLFIIICQSLGIPFIVEENDVKKCGFRNNPEYIKKLSIVKKLFENHYVEEWLDKSAIDKWKNSPYPKNIDEQPTFPLIDMTKNFNFMNVNGLIFDVLTTIELPDLKYCYMPGISSFLGGSGIVITKNSKFPDELFEYIEILINGKNPYLQYLNNYITPYEKVYGNLCNNELEKKSKKEYCNSFLDVEGTFPYYYVSNNKTNIIYLKHIVTNEDKQVSITDANSKFFSDVFTCGEKANYEQKTITFIDKYKLELPVKNNNTIILKSMEDIKDQTNPCNIFQESLEKAKPMQFPYNTFSEINAFELKSPISLLLAHLYYKHNETNEGTFESIINECCDIIDDTLLPRCKGYNKIKFKLGECNEQTELRNITYLNCKITDNDGLQRNIECPYISSKNIKGLFLTILSLIAIIIEIFIIIIVIKFKNEKCIMLSGFEFLLFLILSSLILDISVYFWVGSAVKYKCILKIWTMIIGITGLISSYSIKSEIIISIYNNKKLTQSNYKMRTYLLYVFIFIFQLILLTWWTFKHDGVTEKESYIKNVGSYKYNTCSIGNENILTLIFLIDYTLLVISIIMSYRGRNIPSEFNYSKKIFFTSLLTAL
ncbi:hypothetical protein LY90DRAFT_663100 [Neocallimastix californiae]|uniref:G-protein coupled receptors family 3 profile domain-containing protein n=1 Tax=Neocallimastix californiae TaxID=1754190 RepID=A0A1Y2FR86_9FUNG|nr:hypothetical protein LY90DRAFT_663100 [Neocallimastix californiae]|eukprot:ORY86449.1 hypothetical protein LY90DRAFT_663100 [Neocallimastix californiae]